MSTTETHHTTMGELFAHVIERVALEFPGDGHGRPTSQEWERADRVVGRELDRVWAPGTWLPTFAPVWHNRAWMRSQIKRHLARLDYQTAMQLLTP